VARVRSKKEKGKILDESTKVMGSHEKATIRLFHLRDHGRVDKGHGRLGANRSGDDYSPSADLLQVGLRRLWYETWVSLALCPNRLCISAAKPAKGRI